jgi:DeoR/GlpR family transcriptional regulator of sugar metabolism
MKNAKSQRLLAEERRRRILEAVHRDGRITVEDLVQRFKVSSVTARSDLNALSERGALLRSHGGAVQMLESAQDYPLKFKETLHRHEKARIGQKAAEFIKAGQTVILDSGSTTAEIAGHLKALKLRSLTVITHALNIARDVAEVGNISLIMIGGILREVSNSFVGPHAERMLRDLHADHFFLAVDGLDPATGLSTPDILEAQLNALMIRVSDEVTVVADASKFGRRSLSLICDIGAVRRVITDNGVDTDFVTALESKGIDVVVV